MDNQETLAALGTQDTGRRQANKRERKPRRQTRMDNQETLAILGIQDTGRRQTNKR
jgi:hypothetical protein